MLITTFFFLGILLVVFQTTLLQLLPGTMMKPDLIYLLVAFAAYKFAWIPGILLAFTVGWVLDVVIGRPESSPPRP